MADKRKVVSSISRATREDLEIERMLVRSAEPRLVLRASWVYWQVKGLKPKRKRDIVAGGDVSGGGDGGGGGDDDGDDDDNDDGVKDEDDEVEEEKELRSGWLAVGWLLLDR
ncbi:hypothetical protein TWF718_003228 [Orbilia javanica]|uniref:Uncharacterized protein n=1 Tax=Orbilia javanica TaxID=47235 RepID=A0AAN8R8E8_9PEZI